MIDSKQTNRFDSIWILNLIYPPLVTVVAVEIVVVTICGTTFTTGIKDLQ